MTFSDDYAGVDAISLYLLCCSWWLVLICCERKLLMVGWWLLLVWCERKKCIAHAIFSGTIVLRLFAG